MPRNRGALRRQYGCRPHRCYHNAWMMLMPESAVYVTLVIG